MKAFWRRARFNVQRIIDGHTIRFDKSLSGVSDEGQFARDNHGRFAVRNGRLRFGADLPERTGGDGRACEEHLVGDVQHLARQRFLAHLVA